MADHLVRRAALGAALIIVPPIAVAGSSTAATSDASTAVTAPPTSGAGADTTAGARPACALAENPGGEIVTELPDSPAGEQLRWVLEADDGAPVAEIEERFSADFLAAVPTEQLAPTLADIGAARPTVFEVQVLSDFTINALLDSDEGQFQVSIGVAEDPPHAIEQLLFTPLPPTSTTTATAATNAAAPVAVTTTDLESALAARPGDNAVLVAEVGAGGVTPVFEAGVTTGLPVGSVFKLWVLDTVVGAVEAGELSWDHVLTVRPELKSVPSGVLQECPDDSTITVEQAARLMISISDNTATDVLLDAVGTEAVEQRMIELGLSPESQQRTFPLLTTRQLFTLKVGDQALLADYAAATTDERTAILASLPADSPSLANAQLTPVAIDTVEWFFDRTEIAAVLVALDAREGPSAAPLPAILGANTLVELDPAVWTTAWFKGGSEPGVLSLAWLLTRADGRQFVVVASLSDPAAEIDQAAAIEFGEAAIAYAASV